MYNYSQISQLFDSTLPEIINGNWIKMNSSYENGLCGVLGWSVDTNRYFDATYHDIKIEIKKGRSIWLDLVRYSEIIMGIGESNTITAFFIPSKERDKIDALYLVDTKDLIAILKLDKDTADVLMSLQKRVPRSLNVQASLTIKDVAKIAFYKKQF